MSGGKGKEGILAVLAGPPKADTKEQDDQGGEDNRRAGKMDAASAAMSAMKSGDPEGFMLALEDFFDIHVG